MPIIKEMQRPHLPPSLWEATASECSCFKPLVQDLTAEVLVIGGGFAGLSAAVHLGESGHDVVVLEAAEPGWGASGRNGGQVIPGLKYDPDELERRFGSDLGRRVIRTVGGAPDEVFDLIKRYGIRCDSVRRGWVQPAHSKEALRTVERRAEQWRQRGVAVEILGPERVRELIGCASGYIGGWIDPRGGAVQPLSYARGLARAAAQQGASIFGHSRVRSLRRDGTKWIAQTSGGRVRAEKLILATNGYTDDLWPGLARSVIPVFSYQIATAPLPASVRRKIFPQGHVASDTYRLLNYYRLDAQGRLLMGGRGPFTDSPDFRDGARLRAAVRRLFPEAADIEFEYVWSGRVAITRDHMPHLHALGNNAYAGLGFNGRGVAMATAMGRLLAALAQGRPAENIDFPVTRIAPIRFHALSRPVVAGMIQYYRYLDRKEI